MTRCNPTTKEKMPAGTTVLFFMQMISILSFSVLYSTLILYATNGLNMNDLNATSITGAFLALNYFLHMVSGAIGGRYLSFRSLFAISMVLQILGCAIISIPNESCLLWGLAPFLAGCGLNISCINCLLTQLFHPDDKRRESAFLWNYGGQNVGILVGFLLAGYYELLHAYQTLFLLSALGNLVALLVTIGYWRTLKDLNTKYSFLPKSQKTSARLLGFAIIVALVFVIRLLIQNTFFCEQVIIVSTLIIFALIVWMAVRRPSEQRKKIFAYLILAIAAIIFWTLFLIGPMGLNLFTERNVDPNFFGIRIAPQWVQNMVTIVTIIAAPLFSIIFAKMRERGININIPLQFSLALFLMGLAFAILPLGITLANENGFINVNWVLASYFLQSVGDVFISPIGYAMIGQIAPQELRGTLMGAWLMFGGVTGVLANYLSKAAVGTSTLLDPLVTNSNYSFTFGMVGAISLAAGVLLLIGIPFLNRLIGENIKSQTSRELEFDVQSIKQHT